MRDLIKIGVVYQPEHCCYSLGEFTHKELSYQEDRKENKIHELELFYKHSASILYVAGFEIISMCNLGTYHDKFIHGRRHLTVMDKSMDRNDGIHIFACTTSVANDLYAIHDRIESICYIDVISRMVGEEMTTSPYIELGNKLIEFNEKQKDERWLEFWKLDDINGVSARKFLSTHLEFKRDKSGIVLVKTKCFDNPVETIIIRTIDGIRIDNLYRWGDVSSEEIVQKYADSLNADNRCDTLDLEIQLSGKHIFCDKKECDKINKTRNLSLYERFENWIMKGGK